MNISEISKKVGLSSKQIRDYEKAGLLPKAARSLSGYRQYGEDDLNRLIFISNARKVGFSLNQIAQLLALQDNPNRTSRDVKQLTEQHILALKEKIADLQMMVKVLQSWHCSCHGNEMPDCSILSGLAAHKKED